MYGCAETDAGDIAFKGLPDIKGYVILNRSDNVLSELTCYRFGEFEGRPVYVSYAVCTAEDARGCGLAGMLTEYVRDSVMEAEGISIVSPAEPSLEDYYARFGYEPCFYASERAVMAFDDDPDDEWTDYEEEEGEAFEPEADVQQISPEIYNRYREAFLSDMPHIELDPEFLGFADAEGAGLFSINRGDAVCAVETVNDAQLIMTELIVNPVLADLSMEIDSEIARLAAKKFGAFEAVFRTPGRGRCQSMAYTAESGSFAAGEAYFGFPIE
jgi:hypothetical protein